MSRSSAKIGFTAVEILVVVMIISIMSSIILPPYNSFQATEQAFAAASSLVSDSRFARFHAIEYQTYTRIDFSSYSDGWYVQELCDSITGEPVVGEPIASYTWKTILDVDMRELDPMVTINFSPDPPPTIYYRPDGVLVSDARFDSPPIGVTKATFVYDQNEDAQGAEVQLTPAGIIESRAYYREDY